MLGGETMFVYFVQAS